MFLYYIPSFLSIYSGCLSYSKHLIRKSLTLKGVEASNDMKLKISFQKQGFKNKTNLIKNYMMSYINPIYIFIGCPNIVIKVNRHLTKYHFFEVTTNCRTNISQSFDDLIRPPLVSGEFQNAFIVFLTSREGVLFYVDILLF